LKWGANWRDGPVGQSSINATLTLTEASTADFSMYPTAQSV
jgi:hypothetical protein